MTRYLSITRGSFIAFAMYPFSLFFTLIGNIIYITVVYFLWKQIYSGAESLHGMTFNDTFVYVTLAGSIIILFRTWTDWQISNQILRGEIIMDLIKPLDYELFMLAGSLGLVLFNALIITIPSFVMILIVFQAHIPFGLNLVFFPVSLVFAYLLSFSIDYMVGLTSFYTESIWGISITKEIIVAALSGAIVPLQFFPDSIRSVLQLLPFQAIYNTPLQIITSSTLTVSDYVRMIGIQVFWVVVLVLISRVFFRQAVKVLTVNGG